MSFINSLIEKLNDLQNDEELNKIDREQLNHILKTASDTIWELSEKLAAANMEREVRFKNDGWILCSERLPDESGDYLVTIEIDGQVCLDIGEIDCDGFWKKWNYISSVNVIAWMPLPKIYEEDSQCQDGMKN